MLFQLAGGLFLSTLIGLVAYTRRSLSRSGVLGAILTGTLVFGFGGLIPGLLLVAFFASSSALSHYRAAAKETLADKFQKGSRRDLGQTLANGGWAAVLALAYGLAPLDIFFVAFAGTIAAVTADTWATEIGVLSKQPPRLITTGRPVPVGTSGGVTLLGTFTALAGAIFIGAAAVALRAGAIWLKTSAPFTVFLGREIQLGLCAAAGGLCGSLFDSLLGATVQATFYCDPDKKETERRVHSCGRRTRHVRGYAWLDNDVVNLLAAVFGSGMAVLLWTLFARV